MYYRKVLTSCEDLTLKDNVVTLCVADTIDSPEEADDQWTDKDEDNQDTIVTGQPEEDWDS